MLLLVSRIKCISNVSQKEYTEIVSTFTTLTQPKYRCSDCKRKYSSDPSKMKRQKDAMACGYVADKPRHQYKPDFNNKGNPTVLYSNCIGNHYYGRWASIINYYSMYDKGIMPFEGGLMDQTSKFVEIMDLVHNLIEENKHEAQRKEQLATRNRTSGKRSSKR